MVPTDLNIYIYLEPKWPLFWMEFRPCFGGLTFKNKGQLGSRYIYWFQGLAAWFRGPNLRPKRGNVTIVSWVGKKNASQGIFIPRKCILDSKLFQWTLNKRSANQEISMLFMMYYGWCNKSCTSWDIYIYVYIYKTLYTFCDICHINWCMISSINSTFHWWHFLSCIYAGRSHGKSIQISPQCFQTKSATNFPVFQSPENHRAGWETITCMSQEFSKRFGIKWVISPQYTSCRSIGELTHWS